MARRSEAAFDGANSTPAVVVAVQDFGPPRARLSEASLGIQLDFVRRIQRDGDLVGTLRRPIDCSQEHCIHHYMGISRQVSDAIRATVYFPPCA
jgi:hypothetical protein